MYVGNPCNPAAASTFEIYACAFQLKMARGNSRGKKRTLSFKIRCLIRDIERWRLRRAASPSEESLPPLKRKGVALSSGEAEEREELQREKARVEVEFPSERRKARRLQRLGDARA